MNDKLVQVVLGGQWGDEGKGKVVDCLAEDVDVVVRFQGGANAGHTVRVGDETFILHLLPTGVLHQGVRCLLGPGMVVDTWSLLQELDSLENGGVEVGDRVRIAAAANLVLPHHKRLDEFREKSLSRKSIGTTGRGIGPCYEDKMGRMGLRAADLLRNDSALRRVVIEKVLRANEILAERYDAPALASEAIADELLAQAERLRPMIVSAFDYLEPLRKGEWKGLLEGAQGTLLDIDHGTYPFVTSSNCTIGGAITGSGIAPRHIDTVVMVMKAYTTRVGNGPFPTELFAEEGDNLRESGGEYGATTGRPRRCGWFDAVLGRFAVEINGTEEIALTKLDVLTGLDPIKVATGYEIDGKPSAWFSADGERLERCKPLYVEYPGWTEPIDEIRRFDDLPQNARDYVAALERHLGARVRYVSVGPERDAWLDRGVV